MNRTAGNQFKPSLPGSALVVDEDIEYLEFVQRVVQGVGYGIQACDSYVEVISQLGSARFDIIVVGQGGPEFEGRCVLERASELDPHMPVIVVSRHADMACYMEAMQLGAVDYIAGPFSGTEIERVVKNYAPRSKGNVAKARQTPNEAYGLAKAVRESSAKVGSA